TWFHLMPYRYLPDDFKDKYRSVWVDIPRDLYDPKVGHRLYNDYLDQLEFADQMGFDGLGVNEHHQNAYGLMPSPNIMGAAMARRTRTPTWSSSATRSRSTIHRYAWPRSSRCLTCSAADGSSRAFRSAPRWIPTSATAKFPRRCARSIPRPTTSSSRRGPNPTCSRSTANIPNCATSTCGPSQSSNLIRQSGSPAAVRSRPGISAPTTPTSTASSRTSDTSRVRRWPTATGT